MQDAIQPELFRFLFKKLALIIYKLIVKKVFLISCAFNKLADYRCIPILVILRVIVAVVTDNAIFSIDIKAKAVVNFNAENIC